MLINLTTKYKTRAGHPVTIYSISGQGDFPVHGCIHKPKKDSLDMWTSTGEYYENSSCIQDLIPIQLPSPLQQAVINFLRYTSYLRYKDKVEACQLIRTDTHDPVEMGTAQFRCLLQALETDFPDWKSFLPTPGDSGE